MGKRGEKLTVLFASGDEFLKEQVVDEFSDRRSDQILI